MISNLFNICIVSGLSDFQELTAMLNQHPSLHSVRLIAFQKTIFSIFLSNLKPTIALLSKASSNKKD